MIIKIGNRINFKLDMIEGKLAGGSISSKLPFQLIISTIRRKKLLGMKNFFISKN